MPWLELTLPCTEASQPRLEDALQALGALSVTLTDAQADAPDEQAIFEPGVGEQPLWRSMHLAALFPAETDGDLLRAALAGLAAELELDPGQAELRIVHDQDWERAWLDRFQPLRFGRRTHIVPWNHALPEAAASPEAAVVRLDPGLAFGSGTHPTTALCLDWLDSLDLAGREVLDFGCGSGILAVAALKLGAPRADGIDNDPQAITATLDNAARNGVAERLRAWLPEAAPPRRYPVVVANILASALDLLAPQLAARVQAGGELALSGILVGQEQDLLARYGEWFEALTVAVREDWVRITGVRRR